jgi:hypothetical protein
MNQKQFFQERDKWLRIELHHKAQSDLYQALFNTGISHVALEFTKWDGSSFRSQYFLDNKTKMTDTFKSVLQDLAVYHANQFMSAQAKLKELEQMHPDYVDK